jgi:formate-dependent nitrite reductase membrane component NrfD
MKNRNLLILIALLAFSSTQVFCDEISIDTTETAGKGARIAGIAICAIGVCFLTVSTPLAYFEDTHSDSDMRFLSFGDKGAFWAVGGVVTIGVSIPFMINGYKKKNKYLR